MIAILGGGLSGSLLAYRISLILPRLDFVLIETKDHLAGEQTWSFHNSDVSSESMGWIRPLIFASWNQQEVRFPGFKRVLAEPYHTVTSTSLNRVTRSIPAERILLSESVLRIEANRIYTNKRKLEANVIFDARGLDPLEFRDAGFQKFVGIDLELEEPHGLKHPVIMDGLCEQIGGYRFFYLLPWSSNSLLVEDTRYSSDSNIDSEEYRKQIRDYCDRLGWKIHREIRTEKGVLPIPLSSLKQESKTDLAEPIRIGNRGSYFHWTTGYSFAYAVKTAEAISRTLETNPCAGATDFAEALRPIRSEIEKESRYLTILNRMLFLAAKPEERWKIFHRFYQLNETLIGRFYKGRLQLKDKIRLLTGKPPVPIFPAIKSLFSTKVNPATEGKNFSEPTQ